MLNRLPAHTIDMETEARASRAGFHIEQQRMRLENRNGKLDWYIVLNHTLPGLGGSLKQCHEMIAILQKRHVSHGYNAELGYWWAHDMPEGGAMPLVVYRWVLC